MKTLKTAPKPPAQAAELRERLRGLRPPEARQLREVMRCMAQGDRLMAGQWLLELSKTAPEHPEVLRWRGARHAGAGEWTEAAASLARSAALRPNDFTVLLMLATAQEQSSDHAGAAQTLQAAAAHARLASEWMALSVECDRQGSFEIALVAVEQVLALDPGSAIGLLQRSRCLRTLGQAERAAADCRTLIRNGQLVPRAWFMLLDLKTVRIDADELAQLQQAAASSQHPAAESHLLEFALGKAQEDAGQHAAAFASFKRANHHAQALNHWDGPAFERQVDLVRAAFDGGALDKAQDQGAEIIFLVGMPRSGTTLIEQVLASHSRVEGASELPYLDQVIAEESRRRGQAFPRWVPAASADDWTRLGQRYLTLSARWRARRPVATDKLPGNWLLAGAVVQMLPGARVIDCRRDALETCWSCYKQLFGPQQVGYTYAFDTLAAYWHCYDGLSRFWAARHPVRFRTQGYETLVAEPELQIRALLDFCGLPFEAGCLQFHTAQRAIRTPSALQVRHPLTRTSTPAAGYGALLDPLRELLVRPQAR